MGINLGISLSGSYVQAGIDPSTIFSNGEDGAWIDVQTSAQYQDVAGTTVAGSGDPVARVDDLSGNGNNWTQPHNLDFRPTQQASGDLRFDGVDDNLEFPLGAGFTGDACVVTNKGIYFASFDTDTRTVWKYGIDPRFIPDADVSVIIAVDRALTIGEKAGLRAQYAGRVTAQFVSLFRAFRRRVDLTAIDVSGWDTSSATNFGFIFDNCSSLQSIDVSGWDTSSATTFARIFLNCSSLQSIDVSGWDTSSATNFAKSFLGCSSTIVTTDGGTGNPFADSPCTNYIDAFTNTSLDLASINRIIERVESAETSNGTFDQSGGSAPTVTAEIAALRARGWTVNLTGGV